MNDQNNQGTKDQGTLDQVALLSFVDSLLAERKGTPLKTEELPKIRLALLNEINEAINLHLIGRLDDAGKEELDKMLDANVSNDVLNDFFEKKIPKLDSEVAVVLLNFRAAYVYEKKEEVIPPVQDIMTQQPTAVETSPGIMPAPLPPVSDKTVN